MPPRPVNVVYINSHDTGRYVGPLGYPIATPHLRRLAEEGVLFRQHHTPAPTCSPSRAALLTGQSPHKVGMLGLAHRGFSLRDPKEHLAHFLRARGYETAAWGMADNHVGGTHTDLGYEHWLGWEQTEQAAQYILKQRGQPFFLSASFIRTHRRGRGFEASLDPSLYDPRYTLPPEPLPDMPEVRADWAHFCCDVTAWDYEIGKLIAALESTGRLDDTLIIATTDHGAPFPSMKCKLTRHGTGVFLILRGPGGFRGGKVVDELTSHLDLYPTLCELIGAEVPAYAEGVALSRAMASEPVHDALFGEVTYHAAYEPMRSVRTRRYLYVRRFGDRRLPVLPNIDGGPSKDFVLAQGLTALAEPEEELIDTLVDPQEARNLIDDPRCAGQVSELRARLERWMKETNDPLLDGPVPLPPGARTDDPDQEHAT